MGDIPIGSQNFESWNPLTTEKARLDAILGHVEGVIVFSNTVANGNESYAHNFKVIESLGIDAVHSNQSEIEKSALKYGVNPDLMKAIVFLENSHGYYDVIKPYLGLGQSDSVRPGNVNVETFSKLLALDPYWTRNYPVLNIELTAKVLAEIQSRLQNPTPEAIATLYNGLMKDQISGYGLTVSEYMKEKAWEPTKCFPAHTRIQTSRTTSTAISALRVGDVVLAFDARADKGRGALVPRRVTRLYRNTTTEWIRLRWFDGTAREVITTPGHHGSDALGGFPTILEMTRTGSATVVLASGALTQVTVERTPFCADVAPLFERAMGQGEGVGNAAVKVGERNGWASEAGEGEGWRGYGAGSVMGRGRRGRRKETGTVHMRTVWKLTESHGSLNFWASQSDQNTDRSFDTSVASGWIEAKTIGA